MIGIITGSGLYDLALENVENCLISNKFGQVTLVKACFKGVPVVFYSRHGKNHERLPNMLNYRAYMLAMKELGVDRIIATTVCGVCKSDIPLAKLLLFNDVFFPDNRLPSGELCSIYTAENDPQRGHLIAASLIHQGFQKDLSQFDTVKNLTYGHVNGPRLNSKSEINFIANYADVISQTCGPEAVLAGELVIPYLLLGFGIDYANGVNSEPTSIDELNANMLKSPKVFKEAINTLVTKERPDFEAYNYRFE
ncbi:MTAP family purine nucleoside phosphorylase [Lentisphaera profundi]|uniref:MTAP family purine nucleoside phosphorylase n=1 Tax=Lentisphaera profundi TaxID=1658616 RepID=A0ABY7W011_9BACT|nr:MTAP family purine nucleoside phosphorylase [Lentisphaera profundi]WDE98457.1 MTAP family purine nucleoside phosphorylase [Lentisphaera profundi]